MSLRFAWSTRSATLIGTFVGVLLAGPVLAAEPIWHARLVTGPGIRRDHAMAYDSRRGVVVLFGGTNVGWTGGLLGDTWEWDGRTWTQVSSTGPPARSAHVMTYDAHRGVTVLFGGYDANIGFAQDTWEWNGTTWTLRDVNTKPSPRTHAGMAYDLNRRVSVLFGGYRGRNAGNSGETWEWNGSSWVLRSTSGPPATSQHALAFDAARGMTLLFGGSSGGTVVGTWMWNGGSWALATPQLAPSHRWDHAMTYDGSRQSVLLFGGELPYGEVSGETWEWTGAAWSLLADTGPPPRNEHAMAFDAERSVTVLFGGIVLNAGISNDTWEYGCANGDMDCDASVDLDDFRQVSFCMLGPGILVPPHCGDGDAEPDSDLDLRDFAVFQRVFQPN